MFTAWWSMKRNRRAAKNTAAAAIASLRKREDADRLAEVAHSLEPAAPVEDQRPRQGNVRLVAVEDALDLQPEMFGPRGDAVAAHELIQRDHLSHRGDVSLEDGPVAGNGEFEEREDDLSRRLQDAPRFLQVGERLFMQQVREDREETDDVGSLRALGDGQALGPRETPCGPVCDSP